MALIESVIEATRAAGQAIERVRAQGFDVEHKEGGAGPVTEADHAADALLKERLLALEDVGWLSEETYDDKTRLDRRRLWVVDPLDGTKEFVEGLPQYSVAVALVEDGQPVLAVVHNPATGEMFWAEKGKGAFSGNRESGMGNRERSAERGAQGAERGERISVMEGKRLLASRSETKRGEFDPFKAEWDILDVGSIEYKLALIGAGEAAVTFSRGPKWEWDVCAGALIVMEAGGRAADVFGGPLRFNQPFPKVKGILAGAPDAYERALRRIQELGESDRMRDAWE